MLQWECWLKPWISDSLNNTIFCHWFLLSQICLLFLSTVVVWADFCIPDAKYFCPSLVLSLRSFHTSIKLTHSIIFVGGSQSIKLNNDNIVRSGRDSDPFTRNECTANDSSYHFLKIKVSNPHNTKCRGTFEMIQYIQWFTFPSIILMLYIFISKKPAISWENEHLGMKMPDNICRILTKVQQS